MEASETTKVPQSFSSITHMDTRHLRWATCFATLVALCKGRDGQRWEDESRSAARRLHLPFRLSFLASRTKKRLFGSMFKRSPDWQRLFETGEKLTPYKVPWRGKILPLLSP